MYASEPSALQPTVRHMYRKGNLRDCKVQPWIRRPCETAENADSASAPKMPARRALAAGSRKAGLEITRLARVVKDDTYVGSAEGPHVADPLVRSRTNLQTNVVVNIMLKSKRSCSTYLRALQFWLMLAKCSNSVAYLINAATGGLPPCVDITTKKAEQEISVTLCLAAGFSSQ